MSLDFYPSLIHEGDLTPDACGAEIDDVCKDIHAACKGWGTDEKKLVKALASQSPEARCQIPLRYKEIYEKELKAVMKSECGSRDFGIALQFLAVSPDAAECDMINKACRGLGTDEKVLFPIICGRSNKEMQILRKKYFELFSKDLGQVLDSELGGSFEQIIFNCLQASEEEYDPEYHNEDKMKTDVAELYSLGQGKWGTDEVGLFKILVASPPEYLKKLNYAYADAHDVTLFNILKTELGGKVKEATLFMLGMKVKPYETVANLIIEACKGFGTNELLLTTTVIRYHGILREVMAAYTEMKGEDLQDLIEREAGGDYERLLIELCNSA